MKEMKTIVLFSLMITAFIFMSFRISYAQTSRGNAEINSECQNDFPGLTPDSHIRDHGPNTNRDIPFEVRGLYPELERNAAQGLCPEWSQDSNQKQNKKEKSIQNKNEKSIPERD